MQAPIDGPKIAFLGMGIMGSAMAFNLLKAGHKVRVWNRTQSRAALADLAAAGAEVVPQLKDCVAGAAVVFTCLGDEQDVLTRLTGAQDSVMAFGGKGILVVDFSTIGPQAATTIAAKLAAAGQRFLDAPVTGGDIGAKNATLTIMVGGGQSDFEEALPLLNILGKNIRYCGPSGAGQALKLCNQILCAVNMVSVCEALTLAQKLGLDRALVVDVLGGGAGGSWALSNLGKRILQEDLKPAFSLRNMLKDLRLVFASVGLDDKDSGAPLVGSINDHGQKSSPDSKPAPKPDPKYIPACELAHASGNAPASAHDPGQILPGSALAAKLFAQVAGESAGAPDDFGTQAMIRAYAGECA